MNAKVALIQVVSKIVLCICFKLLAFGFKLCEAALAPRSGMTTAEQTEPFVL